jgi:hypothetical protein
VQELKSHRKFSQHVKYNLSTVLHELRSAKHPEAAALAFVQAGGVAAVAGVLTPDAAADDSSSSTATSAAVAVSPMVVVGACQVLRTVITLCGEGYDQGMDSALTAIVRCISSTALPTAAAAVTAHSQQQQQQQQVGGALGAQMLAAQKTEMCLESTLLISHVAGLRCAMVVSTGCAAAVTAVLRAVAPQAAPVMRACQEAVEKVSRTGDGRRALIAEGACTLLVDSLRTACK